MRTAAMSAPSCAPSTSSRTTHTTGFPSCRCLSQPPAVRSTSARGTRQVAAKADKMCRDMVSAPKAAFKSTGATYKLSFLGAGGEVKEIMCRDDMYMLDAAEAGGLDLPATCRGGICGACVARVASGTTDPSDIDDLSFTMSQEEQDEGMTLICMTRPTSDCVIETQSDWGYSLGVGDWKGATGKFSATPDPLMGDTWAQKKEKAAAAGKS